MNRILLVTNQKPHHKYWIYSIFKNHNVVGVIHPRKNFKTSFISKLKRKIKKDKLYGVLWSILNISVSIYQVLSNKSSTKLLNNYEKKYFREFIELYEKIPKSLIFNVNSINDPETIKLVKDLDVDVICFLGGEIAKTEIIKSAKIASLNFHSGISPFYNGSSTILWAAANKRPNFCGGTLMHINSDIDGGPILYHYLPSIEENDNAISLYMKNFSGAVKLYNIALNKLENGEKLQGVLQKRSIGYFMDADWTIFQEIKLKYIISKRIMKKYIRKESIISYSMNDDNDFTFNKTLQKILNK